MSDSLVRRLHPRPALFILLGKLLSVEGSEVDRTTRSIKLKKTGYTLSIGAYYITQNFR